MRTATTEYEFTLVLSDDAELNDEFEAAIYGGNCDDCLISSFGGRVVLTFARSANSLKDAILSAIADFRSSGAQGELLFVDECNLVTQAEIARKIEKSRQWIHQLIKGDKGFPSPVCEITDGTPLWYWCEVVQWLCQNNMADDDDVQNAHEVALINSALDFQHQRRHLPDLAQEMVKFFP